MATTLEDLVMYHEIAQVKYRYLRALDTHDWDLMRSTFTEDACCWYSGGKYSFRGRDNVVDFLAKLILPSFIASHIIMHPELKRTGSDAAEGIWRLQDIVHFTEPNNVFENFPIKGGEEMTGAGYYYDEYQRVNGEWLIKSTGYERIFEAVNPRDGQRKFHLDVSPTLGVYIPEK